MLKGRAFPAVMRCPFILASFKLEKEAGKSSLTAMSHLSNPRLKIPHSSLLNQSQFESFASCISLTISAQKVVKTWSG
jgi:hypothetical protein